MRLLRLEMRNGVTKHGRGAPNMFTSARLILRLFYRPVKQTSKMPPCPRLTVGRIHSNTFREASGFRHDRLPPPGDAHRMLGWSPEVPTMLRTLAQTQTDIPTPRLASARTAAELLAAMGVEMPAQTQHTANKPDINTETTYEQFSRKPKPLRKAVSAEPPSKLSTS